MATIPHQLPYQLPHQNDVQKLSGLGMIKPEVQSSPLLLTNSDPRPDNSLFFFIFSSLIKMKTKQKQMGVVAHDWGG